MRFALLLLTGCAVGPRGQYVNTMWDQTGTALVSHNLGTGLRLRATYLSNDFRRALADERHRLLADPDAEAAAFLAATLDDNTAFHEVVFTAESDLIDDLRFGESDDTRFQLRLEADGTAQPLVTVYKVRRVTPLHEALYAHKNIWNELWIARFERTVAAPSEVRLQVAGGYGNDEITWTGDQLR